MLLHLAKAFNTQKITDSETLSSLFLYGNILDKFRRKVLCNWIVDRIFYVPNTLTGT